MDKFGLSFGLVIAYLIPGFLGTYALAEYVSAIKALLGGSERVPSTGSIVPLLLIALALGIIMNAFSSVVIRKMIYWSGVTRAGGIVDRKFTNEDLPRYEFIFESTFRYHQFYSNILVAVLLLSPLWLTAPFHILIRIASLLSVVVVLFLAARDSLKSFNYGLSNF